MSKLKKEAMGQYNYLAPTPADEKNGRNKPKHAYPDFYPHTDVTVEIVDPHNLKIFKMKPPTMFESSYHQDYRHPPAENFIGQIPQQQEYTAYVQSAPSKLPHADDKAKEKQGVKPSPEKPSEVPKRSSIKSAGAAQRPIADIQTTKPPIATARAQSAEPKKRQDKESKVNTEFYRALLKARTGSEWKRPPDVSYDVLNPEKPNPERATKPYGAPMENVQERIATGVKKPKGTRPSTVGGSRPPSQAKRSASAASAEAQPVVKLEIKAHTPQVSRVSTASGRSSGADSRYVVTRVTPKRPATSGSSISSIGDDYFLETGRHMNEMLETIQEEEILEQLEAKSPQQEKPLSAPIKIPRGRKSKLKKPVPPVDLFKRKGPDARFYASKKNLRTPNEMERFKKARGRAFMRNVEQAVPELDQRDHEMKYQPERQLFQDARWKIRQDVKDVRNKNLHSLVDRFGKRQQVIKDEQRTRLGDPTYIGRDPVSIYKLQEPNMAPDPHPKLGFKVTYPLHNRRRITPSLGSVQRARNLGSHAQIFNQACAPPSWGPQKVDHSIFLPPMAQKI